MDSPRERACPSCAAAATGPQRWCLECGHELPGPRRPGLRPAVGIATTLAVLVGAASAGGYTLLQDDKQPPPPATTVAQAPPATTPAQTLPPATQEPSLRARLRARRRGSRDTPDLQLRLGRHIDLPPRIVLLAVERVHRQRRRRARTATRATAPSSQTTTPTQTTPRRPLLALSDIALGAAAVAYAPYASADVDLGDPSRTVDGSTRTAWKAPAATDPAALPQLGVYVDLAGKETIRKLVLTTPTPGMNVEIYGADERPARVDHRSRLGPPRQPLRDRGAGDDQTAGAACRYVLVWITGAPPDGARPRSPNSRC